MALDSGLEACRLDLYSAESEVREKYPPMIADKVLRVREMHQWLLGNPASKDAQFITETIRRFGVTKPTAYSDLAILKALMPMLSDTSKDFHRWRFNEMILDTFEAAKKKEDTKTMERAAATYAKFNRVDAEEIQTLTVEDIMVQPFIPVDDPTVLGIAKIPNIRDRQKQLIEKYIKDSHDIEDIEYEPADILMPEEIDDES